MSEWRESPCSPKGYHWIAPLHLHRECDEAWYVLEGRLTFLVDGQEYEAEEGSMVWVPRGSSHTFWNPSSNQAARYLVVTTAKTKALIDAIHAAEDRSVEGLKALFEKFDAEFLGMQST